MELTTPIFDYARMSPASRAATTKEAIARRLVLLRMAVSGDSQIAFCGRTGVAANAWNNLEKARNRISVDTALDLARTTGVSLDWIYRGSDYEHTLPSDLATRIRKAQAQVDDAAERKTA
jgi:transcriptional regulator with XRE-family HTH domain